MRSTAPLLVIGSRELAGAVADALPSTQVLQTASPLEGLWRGAKAGLQTVIVEHDPGRAGEQLLLALRRVLPTAKIVAVCPPALEPAGRAALRGGADDYTLTPLREPDLRRALGLPASQPGSSPAAAPPAAALLSPFSLLGSAADPATLLYRAAQAVADGLGAQSVAVELDDQAAAFGDPQTVVLEAPIWRGERPVGRLAIGPRRGGTYQADIADWLRAYAAFVRDAAAVGESLAEARRAAETDPATSLPNRAALLQALRAEAARAQEARRPLSLVLIEVVGLAEHRRFAGRAAADELVRSMGAALARVTRACDLVARADDDLLAALLVAAEPPRAPGSAHPADVSEFTQRLSSAAGDEEAGRAGVGRLRATIATLPWQGTSGDALWDAALLQLEQAALPNSPRHATPLS